ncbi:hypothetical protein YC2023_043598 [Brassica napus]
MVIQGENQKLSLHQALSLETLFADHLLLIAYEGHSEERLRFSIDRWDNPIDRSRCYALIEEEDLVTEKNEITRKNGNQAAHEELMRSPGAPENLHINNNSPFTYKYHNSQKPYVIIDSENTSAEVNMGTTVSLTWKVPLKKFKSTLTATFLKHHGTEHYRSNTGSGHICNRRSNLRHQPPSFDCHSIVMFGLFGFHGVREEVFVRFLLVFVKRWNKTILLWLRLYVFIRFGEDGLLSLHWNVGMVWWFLAAYWLSEFSGLENWERKLIMNKDWGIIGVVCYATRWAPLLYIALLYKVSRRNDMYTGLVGLSNANKKCTKKYEAPTRYVFGSFGLGALLNRMVVSWLRVFGIRSSLLICQAPILWFERIMQLHIKMVAKDILYVLKESDHFFRPPKVKLLHVLLSWIM